MSRQELHSTGDNCQGDDRQESCSSAGNCQADEQTVITHRRDWLWGKLCLALVGKSIFSKSLIQFSTDGWGYVPPCGLAWGYTVVGVMETFSKMTMPACLKSRDCCSQCLWVLDRPLSTHASTRDFWTLTDKSGLVSCGVIAPFSWVLVCTGFVCALQESLESLLCSMLFYWLNNIFFPLELRYMFVIHLYGYIIFVCHIFILYLYYLFTWSFFFFCLWISSGTLCSKLQSRLCTTLAYCTSGFLVLFCTDPRISFISLL